MPSHSASRNPESQGAWWSTFRRQCQVCLGLPAAGREEQQVHHLTVTARGFSYSANRHQKVCQLERPPLGRIDLGRLAEPWAGQRSRPFVYLWCSAQAGYRSHPCSSTLVGESSCCATHGSGRACSSSKCAGKGELKSGEVPQVYVAILVRVVCSRAQMAEKGVVIRRRPDRGEAIREERVVT